MDRSPKDEGRPKLWWLIDLVGVAAATALIHVLQSAVKAKKCKPAVTAPVPEAVVDTSRAVPATVSKHLDVFVREIPHLKDYLQVDQYPNRIKRNPISEFPGGGLAYHHEISGEELVLHNVVRSTKSGDRIDSFLRAGPRSQIVFQVNKVKAAIVTCGGLCPGLNTVIRELTLSLFYSYGVNTILGIRNGFRGFYDHECMPPRNLNPDTVEDIHNLGGTILGTSRGGFDQDKIIESLIRLGINQLYVIGGDGTHRGAHALYEEIKRRKLQITVVGVPKTIDNDIGIIDRSFGFYTAVGEAVETIKCAKVEVMCTQNSIGIVKLMGRHAGHIAAHAVLASGDANICLVPEIPFKLEGEDGLLAHIKRHLLRTKHCIIVVAEGAGEDMVRAFSGEKDVHKDPSGNLQLPEIGGFLRKQIESFFDKNKMSVKVFYMDPSYMIRSVKANAADQYQCLILAQNAVHGAMAGYTGITVGLVNNRSVYIPITQITAVSPSGMRPVGRTWERVLNVTLQPRFCHHCGVRVDFQWPFHSVHNCPHKKASAPQTGGDWNLCKGGIKATHSLHCSNRSRGNAALDGGTISQPMSCLQAC